MTGPTLREIANQMYLTLGNLPQQPAAATCQRTLAHGLHIILERTGDAWSLRLGRLDVYPSDLEVTLCKRAYRLADDHPDTHFPPRSAGWCVVAITWTGAVPPEKRIR
jgi:hypothetical protein